MIGDHKTKIMNAGEKYILRRRRMGKEKKARG